MNINDDLREDLIDYIDGQIERRDRYRITIEPYILRNLREGNSTPGFCQQVYDYLAKDFDINDAGGPNEPMRLAGQMRFQDDCNYWRPLYEGERSAGLLDPPDSDAAQLINLGGSYELRSLENHKP